MSVVEAVEDRVQDSLNAGGRSTGHIVVGGLICLACVAATAAIAATRQQPVAPGAKPSHRPVVRAAWPALFSVTTLANMRVWNAPSRVAVRLYAPLTGLSSVSSSPFAILLSADVQRKPGRA